MATKAALPRRPGAWTLPGRAARTGRSCRWASRWRTRPRVVAKSAPRRGASAPASISSRSHLTSARAAALIRAPAPCIPAHASQRVTTAGITTFWKVRPPTRETRPETRLETMTSTSSRRPSTLETRKRRRPLRRPPRRRRRRRRRQRQGPPSPGEGRRPWAPPLLVRVNALQARTDPPSGCARALSGRLTRDGHPSRAAAAQAHGRS
mmetsp:Transcript_58896/g.153059  ORF Transcript_58896/g.153059 Transcript_58896/m.153059 type:complete len:208 (+) Transcript_58896:542-1165(+)